MIGVVLSGDVTANTIQSVAHGFVANDPVMFVPYGPALPGGLTAGVVYYVLAAGLATDSFKVSTTLAGSPVDILTEGAVFVGPPTSSVSSDLVGAVCISPEVGTLTINGVSLNTPAWGILDLSELWASQPPLRGTNVTLPGSTGRRPYPRRFDEARWSLHMVISGVCDQAGAPYADEEVGLQTNIGYLLANVVDPPTPPSATRAATLLLPDGTTTRTADVQVTGFDRGTKNLGLMRAVLELTIPGGRFT